LLLAHTLPLIILGGSDRRRPTLPAGVRGKVPLSGYKGAELLFQGRPLVEVLVERLLATGRFDPIYIAGPRAVYREVRSSASLIDTNGTFGKNIRVSLEALRERHPETYIGFITCDVLPEVETLRELMAHFDKSVPCDMWFPLIRAPKEAENLGASSWKPVYRIVPVAGQAAVRILPGHLVIIDPEALRLRFLYHLFQLGYATRNRPIAYRKALMVRSVLSGLLYQDLLHILSFRLPNLTWTVLRAGLAAARDLKAGTITQAALEDALRRLFVKNRHQKKHPERRIHLPLLDALSLALDMDTEEEAREQGGKLV
jgi:hypothetical protein